MTPTTRDQLLEEGAAFLVYGPLSLPFQIELALLVRTLKVLNPVAETTPHALATYGVEYACDGSNTADLIKLALLDQIYQSS